MHNAFLYTYFMYVYICNMWLLLSFPPHTHTPILLPQIGFLFPIGPFPVPSIPTLTPTFSFLNQSFIRVAYGAWVRGYLQEHGYLTMDTSSPTFEDVSSSPTTLRVSVLPAPPLWRAVQHHEGHHRVLGHFMSSFLKTFILCARLDLFLFYADECSACTYLCVYHEPTEGRWYQISWHLSCRELWVMSKYWEPNPRPLRELMNYKPGYPSSQLPCFTSPYHSLPLCKATSHEVLTITGLKLSTESILSVPSWTSKKMLTGVARTLVII